MKRRITEIGDNLYHHVNMRYVFRREESVGEFVA
jgi:hypothetical protein